MKIESIKTAKEFLEERQFICPGITESHKGGEITEEDMIAFAKYHVQEALKAASENADVVWGESGESYNEVDKISILKAYPLENIK